MSGFAMTANLATTLAARAGHGSAAPLPRVPLHKAPDPAALRDALRDAYAGDPVSLLWEHPCGSSRYMVTTWSDPYAEDPLTSWDHSVGVFVAGSRNRAGRAVATGDADALDVPRVWRSLMQRCAHEAEAFEVLRLWLGARGYLALPLSRDWDGGLSAGEAQTCRDGATAHARHSRGVFVDLYGEIDGLAYVALADARCPGDDDAQARERAALWIAQTLELHSAWARGETYGYTVERVDYAGACPCCDGSGVCDALRCDGGPDGCGCGTSAEVERVVGFHGRDHVESGLVDEVCHCVALDARGVLSAGRPARVIDRRSA